MLCYQFLACGSRKCHSLQTQLQLWARSAISQVFSLMNRNSSPIMFPRPRTGEIFQKTCKEYQELPIQFQDRSPLFHAFEFLRSKRGSLFSVSLK